MTIRPMEEQDYDRIIPVLNDWWGGRNMADQLPRLFVKHFSNTSFVAEMGETLMGFLIGFPSQAHPEQAYIHFAGVNPACRGQKVGESLYDRFYQAVAPLGCAEIYSVTSIVNQGSLRFHQRIGFSLLPGDREDENGLPYSAGYDGPGDNKYRFVRGNPYTGKLIQKWDPDYTKVTPHEAREIAEAEASGFIDEADIDWSNLSRYAE